MLITKITTVIAAGSLLLGAITPAFADTGVGVLGNGAASSNNVSVTQNNNNTATQNNDATITNHIDSSASTGGNNADFNTGGNNAIQTGSAANGVSVSNTANSNFMNSSNPCGCDNGSLVELGGNGAFSTNNAALTQNKNNTATQNNSADFTNDIDAHAKTGGNSATDNTGGDNSIFTGSARNAVDVTNTANQNVLTGGSGTGTGVGGTTLKILGNGALSNNNIADTSNNSATATQNNSATFFNDVDASATTGKNDADFNTDGNNSIFTGSASNFVGVVNIANRNVLSGLDQCGCATGDLFKIADNGAFSGNNVAATENNDQTATQNNAADFSNFVDPHAKTGFNDATDNTGSLFLIGDPNTVLTGNAASQTEVVNTSNENVLTSNGVSMGGWSFSWDPSSLMGAFGF